MSHKIIKVNTDQGRYRKRLINYDRVANMPSDSWDYEAFIDGKAYLVSARHGGTVPNSYNYPARTSAVLAIECISEGNTVVMGAQIPANKATRAGAAEACLAGALGTGWSGTKYGRWLWDGRSQKRDDEAWFTLVRAYEILVAREKAAAS